MMTQEEGLAVGLPEHTGSSNILGSNGVHEYSVDDLERELPVVFDGQVSLGELLSRVVQSIYAELSELAETMPNMSDSARKRTLADWVVKTKKQVVKLYAVAKWARDASTVQKCMNITAFLMTQNQQFEDAMSGLNYAKESLDPARLRNHDLLTSLDVLTTGSYLRLPTCIKKMVVPLPPLADSEVVKTLSDMEDVIRFRLRTTETIPVEMSQHRIANGRVHFTAPKLFEVSLCLRGAHKDDGWFFVQVEFLINIGGGLTGLQDIPRVPTGIMARHITNEADARLAHYLPLPEGLSGAEVLPRPQLPEGVTDTPLVRLYNFLQMMSLSYQLEILWYQAERMRSLGWADYLTIQMDANRKVLVASYWVRSPPPSQGRPRIKLPPFGGTLTISLVEAHAPTQVGQRPARSSKGRVIAKLQQKSKLGGASASDKVESLRFEVRWEPAKGALGVVIPAEDVALPEYELAIDADNLDFEALLGTVIERHSYAVLKMLQFQLQQGPTRAIFSPPGIVSLVEEAGVHTLRVRLCADEIVVITIDSRTGRMNLWDTGALATAGRGPKFAGISDKINEDPPVLPATLVRLRIHTIADIAEQKATYLGLQCFRRRNFSPEELTKLGPSARGTLYIQLCNFPSHYLVLVITDDRFRYALITTRLLTDSTYSNMIMEDIAWLDFSRIHGEEPATLGHGSRADSRVGAKRKRDTEGNYGRDPIINDIDPSSFNLETQVLRELYSYCCARVAYINVERQLKLRGIPFTHVNPTNDLPVTTELAHIRSTFARSVPALCVQSKDILSGAPAAEAAMPNIRVTPLNWWSDKNAQVVTSVKLKYVQQPMGKSASTSTVIRPSKRIIYDTMEAVVSFLSENVNTCVDEFLEEWARVSKMVVIAREVAQMAKETHWEDVRLLSFDLQTVEFAYTLDYSVSISCEDQLSPTGGNFDLRFSRCQPLTGSNISQLNNPHGNAESFLRQILRHGHGRLAPSLHRLVTLLRDTLPIVVVLDEIRQNSQREGQHIDTFAKAAGWYRLIYGDSRHVLDFRLITGRRVAILDGSRSLFDVDRSNSTTNREVGDERACWQPIPDLAVIVEDAVKETVSISGVAPSNITAIGIGVICDTSAVNVLGRAIHTKVLQKLLDISLTV